jgi:acyl-CoA reductase-like NAD-dependent aldehyde dehydrogenase
MEQRIIQATGIAVGRQGGEAEHARIEAALQEALHAAQADGVTDPDQLRTILRTAADEARKGS